MSRLSQELNVLAHRQRNGAFVSRTQRRWGWRQMARELRALGYQLPGAHALKRKHVDALVTSWTAKGLAVGTIKNRMAWLRRWAESVGKGNLLPHSNAEMGIPNRAPRGENLAHVTPDEAMASLPYRMQLALRLQMLFGLRVEESLKLRVAAADQGGELVMQGSWCKNGRARAIRIVSPAQRALLDEVRRACGTGSLIPDDRSYIAYRKSFEHAVSRCGIRHMHGHRHWYAQQRYAALAGMAAPFVGGPTFGGMSAAQRAADYQARMRVSGELGHGRLYVTDTYLGKRHPRKVAR